MLVNGEQLIVDFCQVAVLAGVPLSPADVKFEALPAPHRRPTRLPAGKMAVYVFCTQTRCLKVGKVGPKSQARFTTHHYAPASSMSNLSRSLLGACGGAYEGAPTIGAPAGLTVKTVGAWVEANCCRYHFFLGADQLPALQSLLEAFLQCRLQPMFEGG